MNQAEWEREIRSALARQPGAVPGRAGETPVGMLAERLRITDAADPDVTGAARAMAKVVAESETEEVSYWVDLCHLAVLSELPSKQMMEALYRRFSQGTPRAVKARATIMVTLTDLGRRLTPSEIQAEKEVENRFPMLWVDAWVRSGWFDLVREHIRNRLTAGELSIGDVILRLPSWYQRLGPLLSQAAEDWIEVLTTNRDRKRLLHWFEVRGVPVGIPQDPAHRSPSRQDPQRPVLPETSREFLRKKTRIPRLNGGSAPTPGL